MDDETLSSNECVHQQPIGFQLMQESYRRLADCSTRRCCVISIQNRRALGQDLVVDMISQTWTVDGYLVLVVVPPMM